MSRGLYVKVYTGFFGHRKTAKLTRSLGEAGKWLPVALWCYAVDEQPDGDFSSYSAEDLADVLHYTGDASSMLQALLAAGFMDSDPLRIHNWAEHNEYHNTYAERAKKAAAARWAKPSPSPIPPSTPKDRDRDRDSESEQAMLKHASSITSPEQARGSAATHTLNRCSLQEAGEAFGDYSADEVKAVWLSFEGGKQGDAWMWGKKPVSDWRTRMEQRLIEARKKGPANGNGKSSKVDRLAILNEIKFKKEKMAEVKNVHYSQHACGGEWDAGYDQIYADLKAEVRELEAGLITNPRNVGIPSAREGGNKDAEAFARKAIRGSDRNAGTANEGNHTKYENHPKVIRDVRPNRNIGTANEGTASDYRDVGKVT